MNIFVVLRAGLERNVPVGAIWNIVVRVCKVKIRLIMLVIVVKLRINIVRFLLARATLGHRGT
jgi:hypothetical protein